MLKQKQPSKGFFKKGVRRILAKFTRKHLCRKNQTLAQVLSCEFCKICRTLFYRTPPDELLLNIVLSKNVFFICFNDSSSKKMKNVCYFILKALLVFKIVFCLDFLVMQKKQLNQKDQVIFEIYDITAWVKNNCNTHIAQYSRIKNNQTWFYYFSIALKLACNLNKLYKTLDY